MNSQESMSAMVRLVLHFDRNTKTFEFKRFDKFPLAFITVEDSQISNYDKIEEIVKSNYLKIYKLMQIRETGVYEFVGKFVSNNLVDETGLWLENISWDLQDMKYYQLSEQDMEKLSG